MSKLSLDAKRAVAIKPNSATAYQALSDALIVAIESKGRLRATEKAMCLDPIGRHVYLYDFGAIYIGMGCYEDAIPALKGNLLTYPNNVTLICS